MNQTENYVHLSHTFEPVYDNHSRVLILGTFPSVKSRENQFYYGHPQNRFWKLISTLTGSEIPQNIGEKKQLLMKHCIAIWDVIAECDIIGSSDSSIKNVIPADLSVILNHAQIEHIFANGGKAYELYMRYAYPITHREIKKLPSSSPANAAYGMERLLESWRIIQEGVHHE